MCLIERERERKFVSKEFERLFFFAPAFIFELFEREREMLKEPFQKRREPLESRFNIPFFSIYI